MKMGIDGDRALSAAELFERSARHGDLIPHPGDGEQESVGVDVFDGPCQRTDHEVCFRLID